MIIGIEGTGSQGWGQGDIQRTFVRRVLDQAQLRPKYYFIGPCDSGLDGMAIIKGAWSEIQANLDAGGPLVLVGYSRGAAYCMELCLRWGRIGGTVDVLVLFDAVARQPDFTLPDKVPANVALCYHAYRDPRAGSRFFFQNVGLYCETGKTRFEKRMFFGSHGALDGTSWDAAGLESGDAAGNVVIGSDDRDKVNVPRQPVTSKVQDDAAANAVAAWMWPRLIACGVLPRNAQPLRTAPPFGGSRQPGASNPVN